MHVSDFKQKRSGPVIHDEIGVRHPWEDNAIRRKTIN